jgi:uncharacterized membrane protein
MSFWNSLGQSIGQGVETVANDQMKAQTDPKILIPNVVGVLLIVAGIVVAVTSCNDDKKNKDSGSCSPWTLYLIFAGIAVLIMSNVAMMLLHPRAYMENVAINDTLELV